MVASLEIAHRHVLEHAATKFADGFLTHRRGLLVLRLKALNTSILKTELSPVISHRVVAPVATQNRDAARLTARPYSNRSHVLLYFVSRGPHRASDWPGNDFIGQRGGGVRLGRAASALLLRSRHGLKCCNAMKLSSRNKCAGLMVKE